MNTIVYWIAATFIATNCVVPAGNLPPIQAKVLQLMGAGHRLSSEEIVAILGSDRAEALALIKSVARSEVKEFIASDHSRTQLIPELALTVLLRLPDPEVLDIIGTQLAEFQRLSPYATLSYDLFGEVERARQPKLLSYIAQGMFRAGDAEKPDFEMRYAGKVNRSWESFMGTMRLLEAVEESPPNVRAWARAMQGAHHLPNNERREMGRLWWQANETAIRAGNYAAVRPGISPAEGAPRTQPNSSPNPGDAKRVWPLRPSQPPSPPSGSPLGAVVSPSPAIATKNRWFLSTYAWLGIGAVILCTGLCLFLRFRKNLGSK